MFRGHHRQIRLLFGASDAILLCLAFRLAYWVRERMELHFEFYILPPEVALLLVWSMLVWIGSGYWWEIYDRIDAAHPRVILRDAFRQCLLGAGLMVLFQYLLRLDLSRFFVAIFAAFAWVLMCLVPPERRTHSGTLPARIRHAPFCHGRRAGRTRPPHGAPIRRGCPLRNPPHGFPGGRTGRTSAKEIEIKGTYPVHPLDELARAPQKPRDRRDHFRRGQPPSDRARRVLLACDEEGVRTHVAVDFFPHINSRIYLNRLGTSPLLTFSATPHDEIRLLVKRITDILLAGAALVLLFPFMLLIMVIVRLTSPGPAIFRQERCGLNGRRFVFYKFRSMCENAEAMRASLEHLSERQLALKIPNDPRLTPVGRWLRKFSFDELPQLWNVLKGDMSLVGPRPALPEEVEHYQRWQRRRLRMRPGLTCLWAVSGRDSVDFETWMKLDMEYIDKWSLALDWKIILRTVPQVLSGKGAH